MKRLISLTTALFMGAALSLVLSQVTRADDDAGQFLVALQGKALTHLANNDISEDERETRFRALMSENFDLDGIASFVIGKYWRNADETARSEFKQIFEDIMVQRFLPTFNNYAGAAFKITKVTPKQDFYIVFSDVKTENGETAQVLWRIEKKADESFVITDVAAEGISLRNTYRSDYTSALKSVDGNLTTLNQKLREKIKAGDFAPRTNS
ncbi:MlaC/ttg2D family ABC transporter substrate-binding protein [Kiloniella laminariae]|uniref:MlaC/ttg2D family ABC transporter substrate-binding protein n=1 Tax=Kiloniella laminariae TaxID=454162 RepID=UPI0012FCAEF8|nr:ABC transporter substrate-binding protein [Kiloniella laminariae]